MYRLFGLGDDSIFFSNALESVESDCDDMIISCYVGNCIAKSLRVSTVHGIYSHIAILCSYLCKVPHSSFR